jgi:hypothetical protein
MHKKAPIRGEETQKERESITPPSDPPILSL